MKRKLYSVLMSVFAFLLLMGATVRQENETMVMSVAAAEFTMAEDQAGAAEMALESQEDQSAQQVAVATPGSALSEAEVFIPVEGDETLLLDGEPVDTDTQKSIVGGVSYVSIRAMALEFEPNAAVSWNGATSTTTITTDKLNLSVTEGQSYLVANGRYLYLPLGIQVVDGVSMVPLTVLAKAFDATVSWDAGTGVISVVSGSGGILSGDAYYDSDSLFWMSRIIQAESGNEILTGKIGVGNVVLNRIANPAYPDTLLGVLSQKNQFSTYQNGNLANRTPNDQSVIAAKLVLDGAVVAGLETATHFDTGGSTWASKNKTCVAIIGGHKFYG